MIIVEERLKELFEALPQINVSGKSYNISYGFGSHKDLLRFMNSERKFRGGVEYPLIWLETPIERDVRRDKKIDLAGLTLILATLSNAEKSNVERLEVTFKPTLIPLYDMVIKALKRSGFTQIINNGEQKVTTFYNYGVNEEEHEATDIWDVLKIQLDLIMDNTCPQAC